MSERDLWSWFTDKVLMCVFLPAFLVWVERSISADADRGVLSTDLGFMIGGLLCLQSALPWMDPWKGRRYSLAPVSTRLATVVSLVGAFISVALWLVTVDSISEGNNRSPSPVLSGSIFGLALVLSFVLTPTDPGDS